MRRHGIKKTWWLWLVLALALWQTVGTAQQLGRRAAGVGMRFSQPLEAAQLEAARTAAAENGLSVSFWGEQPGQARTEAGRSAEAVAVFCDSQPDRCWPAVYSAGTAPGTADQNACAVSEGLAQALWGSTRAVGNSLYWQQQTYIVCGVFRGDETRLIYLGQGNFTALELTGVSADNPVEAASQYRSGAGLPQPSSMVAGPILGWLTAAGCWLPLLLPGCWLAFLGLRWLATRRHGEALLFVLALVLAIALPLGLESLPGWLIPARWSDFSFWTNLAQQAEKGAATLFSLPPTGRDLALRRTLAVYLLWLSVSCAAAVGLMGHTAAPK